MDDEIIDVGYRKLPGDRPRRWRPWPIARTALELALRKRSTKIVGGLCAVVFFTSGVFLIVQVILGRMTEAIADRGEPAAKMVGAATRSMLGDSHEALSGFIVTQMFCTAILLGVAGGGLVADDRRTGAFELYFSRPLSRRDYALGKMLAAALVPVATIIIPFLILWGAAVGISPPHVGSELLRLGIPGVISAVTATVLLTTTIVGASAVGEHGRTVAILYVTLFIILSSLGDGLSQAGYDAAGYLAPQRDLQTVSDELLGVSGASWTANALGVRHKVNDSAWLSAAALLGYSALGLLAFVARLRKQVVG